MKSCYFLEMEIFEKLETSEPKLNVMKINWKSQSRANTRKPRSDVTWKWVGSGSYTTVYALAHESN